MTRANDTVASVTDQYLALPVESAFVRPSAMPVAITTSSAAIDSDNHGVLYLNSRVRLRRDQRRVES